MNVLPKITPCRCCHTDQNNYLEITNRSIYSHKMHHRYGTFTGPNHRLAHRLFFAGLLVVADATLTAMTAGAKADVQVAKGDKLPIAPIVSDGGSSTSKQSEAANKPSTKRKKKGMPADAWTNPTPTAPYWTSYWNPFGIDFGTGVDGNSGAKKFGYTSPSYGSASSIDKLKLGDSYLGIETQRRLQTHVPSGRVDCATDEECEDYSVMPRTKSPGSVGTRSSGGLLNSRKPFFGLSVTTPIE